MMYQEYLDSPFCARKVDETEFERYEAIAGSQIEYLISGMIPYWLQMDYPSDVITAIKNATVQQIDFLAGGVLTAMESATTRKSETLEGYSLTFEDNTSNGMRVIETASKTLFNAFNKAGMLCQVVY